MVGAGMALNATYWSNTVVTHDSRDVEFCTIPACDFLYGRGRQPVQLRAAYTIARYPVTKAEFHVFLNDTGYDYPDDALELMDMQSPFPESPATPISWLDAKIFVRWLRKTSGEYYSLPTQFEWEVAARGRYGTLYPWGNDEPTADHAHFSTDEPTVQTAVIGTHPLNESPFGCRDTVGNVWEWCLDVFDNDNAIHVARGGGCSDGIESCSCVAQRYSSPAALRPSATGFRVTYLPGDMFGAYRIAMQGENSNDVQSTVVKPA